MIYSLKICLFFCSRSVMKERASMRQLMIKRCGSMDTMTVTHEKLDIGSHPSDPSDLTKKSTVVVTYSINDEDEKVVWSNHFYWWTWVMVELSCDLCSTLIGCEWGIFWLAVHIYQDETIFRFVYYLKTAKSIFPVIFYLTWIIL